MNVTVEVVGEGEEVLDVAPNATYGDLIRAAGYSPQEVAILVGERPVPEDRAVDADRVKLLRLIRGGDDSPVGETVDDGTGSDASAGDTIQDPATTESEWLDFTLPNEGAGPDPFTLSACDAELAMVFCHRHYLCGNCRKQVTRVTERYGEFVDRDTEVVSVVPATREKATDWAETHEVPFPLLADPETSVGDEYGQPVKFGFIGRTFELLGRMPQATLVDLRQDPELLWTSAGSSPVDRPDVDQLLAEIDKFR